MHSLDSPRTATSLAQVYLLDRDAGLLCRILSLYAARGLDVLRVDYAYAAQHVMKLQVSVDCIHAETEEVLRVLVDKASTLIGVLAASDHAASEWRAA
ncbi:hypothetical protein GCM10027034_37840 [Ramlibacter solisilvae]|uniref:ACT domain-containing protein n=1 Tax=Ramlibacter tataouinensis TaxID=94132 RepID=A0A127JZT9_9BURK|nr:hypothetical protein [Ramlibacter tataouinensis]AMO23652.1 hypothetical protein UC35_13105 [Ramlibacter tataouinensis]